jgi:P4 family phage/plasmid primase-like protien
MIPKQLDGLRFNRVLFKEKRAFESGWQNKPYTYGQIQTFFPQENYGIICGKDVRVLDDDTPNKGLITLFLENFGETFRVRDHLYFKFDKDDGKKIIFNHPFLSFPTSDGKTTNHMGEVQGEGTYVVGAGSIHPSGEIYEVKNDCDIITISWDKFKEVFGEFMGDVKLTPKVESTYNAEDDEFIKSIKEKWVEGNRQDLAMSLAGYLRKVRKLGLKNSLEIVRRICLDCNDTEFKQRMSAVESTYQKDEKEIKGYTGLKEKEIGIKENPYEIFGVKRQASEFYSMQPYFYDSIKTFHLWNGEDGCWESCDEVDMLNILQKNIPHFDTINSKARTEIIEALKQIGRDKKPKDIPKTWIQFKNKIVDVKSGEEFKPSPEYFTTNPLPWNLGESDETPTIDKLIEDWVVDEKYQDESYVKTMKQIIAYTISSDQFLQRIIALCGAGMNGKGTFIKLIEKFIGDKNLCSSDIRVLSSNNFETASLYKKLCCIMGEVDANDLKNTNTIKKISGEDKMRYEFKGKGAFTDESITTCLIATNSLPSTPDKSLGFYRRWLIIDFPHQFSVKRDLIGQIPEVEFENLGRCCLNLLKEMYQTNQFENEGKLIERMDRYEERSNPIMRFIELECFEDPNGKTEVREFCNAFNEFLKNRHLRVKTPLEIKRMIKNEGFEEAPRKVLENGEVVSKRFFINLVLKISKNNENTTDTTNTTDFQSHFSPSKMSSKNGSIRSICSFPQETEQGRA